MERIQAGWLVATVLLAGAGCGSGVSSSSLVTDGGTNQANVTVVETDLVTDVSGGNRVDPNVVNPWGIANNPQGAWWISDNGTGRSSIFDGTGAEVRAPVTIPLPAGSTSNTSAPTGVTFNTNTANFMGDVFLFATEDGTIAGWQTGDVAAIRVDNSQSGAVYKGIAIANNTLYVANFNAGTVERFDANFGSTSSFTDSTVPTGFAPFNVANINDKIYVAFAKQDSTKEDDVAGAGNGFIDVFDPSNNSTTRLISNGVLNSPWGMVVAPSNFGAASGKLLVGNFGDGTINVFDPTTGAQIGQLQKSGAPLVLDGLWGLAFGNGGATGATNTLFFTAGPDDEQHGVFGKLELNP